MGHTVALTKHLGQRMEAFPPGVHGSPINPLVGLYPTADDRYISFVMMQPTKFWADVCRHMDLDELADDPRFATVESIAENTEVAAEILKEAMSKRPLAEWSERFATLVGSVGAGAGHAAGGRGRPDPCERVPGAGGRARVGRQPGAVRCQCAANRPCCRALRSKLTKYCWNSVWIGTASSSSRRPAPSPRSGESPNALRRVDRHLPAVLGRAPTPGGR